MANKRTVGLPQTDEPSTEKTVHLKAVNAISPDVEQTKRPSLDVRRSEPADDIEDMWDNMPI